ncbi:unnamed protein product [Allacma fusca]|uniref:Uncharacterized protein n=1 Tax=Allacma fusca TaxID=39272 RepID=A0A8J2LG06_9HEXA|nr:unnamed protein product [Allacma fusca]
MSVFVVQLIFSKQLQQLLLFLLLITTSQYTEGWKCSDKSILLRGPYGIIQTPNFPNKFDTPIVCKWIIDSTEVDWPTFPNQRKAINVYLTQMNLKENLTFVEYNNYSLDWPAQSVRHELTPKTRTRVFRTTNRYLGIEFELTTPYQSHFRTREYFLNEYGFNITYEIVPEAVPQRNDSCSFSVCSFAGKCLVSHDYQKFFCDCLQGHFGPFCQNNYKNCDPQRNITFCARGTCRNIGSWSSVCICPEGYVGPKCENQIRPVVKECPGPDCEELCSNVKQPNRPCSCHNGRLIPKGWVRYEGKLKLADVTLSQWDSRNVSKPSNPIELKILSRIEQVLTQQLQTANFSVGNVSIISVGTASEFVFQFFGDPAAYNASFTALTLLKQTGRIDNELVLGGSFNFDIQPSLLLKSVLLSTTKTIRTGEDFSITCEAVGSAGIKLSWYKDGIAINSSLATRHMYEDHIPRKSQDRSVSRLILYKASMYDRGEFTCQAADMGEMQCASSFVDVLLPPIIEVEPMSLTLLRNESTIITCFANNEIGNHTWVYTWLRDDERIEMNKPGSQEVVEELDYPHGSLLRVLQAESSAKYSCVVENYAGKSRRDVHVAVLNSVHSPSCRRELDPSSVVWEWAAVKQTSLAKCPPGYMGYAQRACQLVGSKPRWTRGDFSRCISSQLKTINNTLQKVKMGFAVQNKAEDVMELLGALLESKKFLYAGEGESMIHVLNDAAKYAQDKKRGTRTRVCMEGCVAVKEAFRIFFNTTVRLLAFQESCVHQRSLITLIRLVQSMATHYTKISLPSSRHKFQSEVLIMEMMRIDSQGQYLDFYNFPRNKTEYPAWLNVHTQVPLESSGIRYDSAQFASLLFIVFRNLTDLLSPPVKVFPLREKSVELVSSIVTIMFPSGYNFHADSHIHLEFDISPEVALQSAKGKVNLTCGALEMVPDVIRWTTDACTIKGNVNNTIYCQCDTFGHYAVLSVRIVEHEKEGSSTKFHWSVLAGCIVCIMGCAAALLFISVHLQFRYKSNSIYFLKILVCLTLIVSILLIMFMRTDTTSIGLSTSLCSLLIISLCCHLTKSIYVLLTTQLDLFPWLRSVSLVTLLCAVSFGCILPVWTAAAALSHSQTTDPESSHFPVLSPLSPVFSTFAATVGIIVLVFLVFYYKAVLQLRSMRSSEDPGKNYIIDYRMKTLNRALVISLSTLVTTLATVLFGNITNGVIYQYFFGLSTFLLGILVFLSYTVKSEYPIPNIVITFLCPRMELLPDPENLSRTGNDPKGVVNSNRSPEKRFENGQVAAGLLDAQHPANNISMAEGVGSDATLDTFMGSSLSTSLVTSSRQGSVKRTLSALNVKRPSFTSTSNKIPRSMTNPVHIAGSTAKNFPLTLGKELHHSCSSCCKKNKSFRSASVSSKSLSVSESFKPERGRCLLSEVAHSDYVMPSISSQIVTDKATAGLSSSSDIFARAYGDPSPQYLDNVNERGITQFLTFHQQQFEADDKKLQNCAHSCYIHLGGPKSKHDTTSDLQPDSVAVRFNDNSRETDGSHSSYNIEKSVVTFHRGEKIPEIDPEDENQALLHPAGVAIPGLELISATSLNGLPGIDRRSKLSEVRSSPGTEHNSDTLVKGISNDLDILLDRPKRPGPDYSDVEL